MVNERTPEDDEVAVHLKTRADSELQEKLEKQMNNLSQDKEFITVTATLYSFEFILDLNS